MKKALITGITGQDGSYLAELLLSKGYEVHGLVRRVAQEDFCQRAGRISHILDKISIHSGTLESYASIFSIVEKIKPDECYHLAAQSFVTTSFEDAFSTMNTNINGTLHILAALKERAPDCRFYFAASSEMFGKVRETPQNEDTPFHPRSPYGISKVTSFDTTRNYREAYGMFACSGILFNHESERRGMEFVTRKISSGVAAIKAGKQDKLHLGNLDSLRDWGYAPDYIEAMWLMLQQEKADDYVIATGQTHSVQEFVETAFAAAGLDWQKYVVIDDNFKRPAEVDLLVGDAAKARLELGWKPKVNFKDLIKIMVESDLKRLQAVTGEKAYTHYVEDLLRNKARQNSGESERDWDDYWASKKKKGNLLYDAIAVFYRKYIIKRALNRFIKKTFAPGAILLHAGCGGGQVDTDIIRYAKVTALDISQCALDRYQALNGSYAQTLKGSIFEIPLPDNSVDGVYNLGVMEHFTEEEIGAILKEFYRVLRPQGRVLLFWPPEFGLSVSFMKIVHFILNNVLKKNIKLHPDEITRISSRPHARRMLENSGFVLVDYYFGMKDAFTHAILTAEKINRIN